LISSIKEALNLRGEQLPFESKFYSLTLMLGMIRKTKEKVDSSCHESTRMFLNVEKLRYHPNKLIS